MAGWLELENRRLELEACLEMSSRLEACWEWHAALAWGLLEMAVWFELKTCWLKLVLLEMAG